VDTILQNNIIDFSGWHITYRVQNVIFAQGVRLSRYVFFYTRCPRHPNPLISFIGNCTLSDLHRQYNKYTECNRRNGPEFGRVFLLLNYTEKPQNTYIQSWTVSEIMAS